MRLKMNLKNEFRQKTKLLPRGRSGFSPVILKFFHKEWAKVTMKRKKSIIGLMSVLFKGPNRLGVSIPSSEDGNRPSF
jgi:hypothetical protein